MKPCSRDLRVLLAMALPACWAAGCSPDVFTRQQETARFTEYLQRQAAALSFDPNLPLTQKDCEELAVANSLDLRVKWLALQMQDDKVRMSLASGLPDASDSYSDATRDSRALMKTGGRTTELQDRRQQNLAIAGMLPVLDWGLTYYSWQIALDRQRQEALLLRRAEQLLRRDVRIAYARHAGAVRQERLSSIAYQAAEQVLRVARSLEKAEMAVPADTALVESALAEAALQLSLARQAVEQTHLVLSQLMSLPPGMPFRIDETLPPLPPVPTADKLDAFARQALAARPELAVQDLERHASASAVKRDAAAFFPRLDLTGSFNWSGQSGLVNPAFFTGGFVISHSLLDGGRTLFQYQLSRKAVDVEKERSLLVSLGILYEVELLALRVRQASETVVAAEAVEKARKAALDRVISLYKEGLEDEAGAARALADLTVRSTALDSAQTEYLAAWHALEAAVLPEQPFQSRAATQPASQPVSAPLPQTMPGPASLPASLPTSLPAWRPAGRSGGAP